MCGQVGQQPSYLPFNETSSTLALPFLQRLSFLQRLRYWVPFRRRKTVLHPQLFVELYLSLLLGFVKKPKPVCSTHPEKPSIIPWHHGAYYYLHYDDTYCCAKRSDKEKISRANLVFWFCAYAMDEGSEGEQKWFVFGHHMDYFKPRARTFLYFFSGNKLLKYLSFPGVRLPFKRIIKCHK